MITIYYNQSNRHLHELKDWCGQHQIPYQSKRINDDNLSYQEFLQILAFTKGGITDIIPTNKLRSLIANDQLTLYDLYRLVLEKPTLTKNLISVDFHRQKLCVGFNSDRIRIFITKAERQAFIEQALAN